MAVTTTKTNIMTIIEEDGGDPTGAGGKVINDNFKKIDDLFDGDDCKSAISLTQAPDIAKNTGFSNPGAQGASYRVTSGNIQYPVAIWGTSFQTGVYFESYDHVSMAPIAKLPPYGPFMYRVMAYVAPNASQSGGYYIEFIIHGYNGNFNNDNLLGTITYSHGYDGATGNWSFEKVIYDDEPDHRNNYTLYVKINNGSLYCGALMYPAYTDRNACIMQVTAIALYSDDTPFPDTNIYYYDTGNSSS